MCNRCSSSTAHSDDYDMWLKCRTVKGLYDGVCGNCKRQEKGCKCSLASIYEAEITAEKKWDDAEDKALVANTHKRRDPLKGRTAFKESGYFNG